MLGKRSGLACPICRTTIKTNGDQFSGLRSIALHVAGKAKGLADHHRSWVYHVVPSVDIKSATINQIGDQIEFYVSEAVQELETTESIRDVLIDQASDTFEVGAPGGRSEKELEQYITAYKLIWTTETRLHTFVATILIELRKGSWWTAFPNDLQQKCLERAQQDNHRSPLHCYIDLLDFGDIIKHNKDVFSNAFDRLRTEYKDPRAEFHSKLRRVNDLRILVMHPVRQVAPSHDDLATLERFAAFVRVFVNES
jgi:hypothetical protein